MSDKLDKKFIGIPFKDGGRGFDGADCYGLVSLYFREALGITLPDYRIRCEDTSRIARQIAKEEKNGPWIEIDRPEKDCVVLFALDCILPGVRNHIGVYHTIGRILQTTASKGSHLIRLNQPFMQARTRGYFAYNRK